MQTKWIFGRNPRSLCFPWRAGEIFSDKSLLPVDLDFNRHTLVVLVKVWKFSQTEGRCAPYSSVFTPGTSHPFAGRYLILPPCPLLDRVAGTNRGGALLRGHHRFNFVKVQYRQAGGRMLVGYMQLRGLMKLVDRREAGQGESKLRVARHTDGRQVYLGRWLEVVPGPVDPTGQARVRWATPPADRVLGNRTTGGVVGCFWYQILDAETILESVQLIPIPMRDPARPGWPAGTDTGQDTHLRQYYVHTLGKSAAGET